MNTKNFSFSGAIAATVVGMAAFASIPAQAAITASCEVNNNLQVCKIAPKLVMTGNSFDVRVATVSSTPVEYTILAGDKIIWQGKVNYNVSRKMINTTKSAQFFSGTLKKLNETNSLPANLSITWN